MRTPFIPFSLWIAILTLTGGAAWSLVFALALAEGGSWFLSATAVATVFAPFVLVYVATRSWPQQAVPFCFCYSAAPLLGASASILAFTAEEWLGTVFWTGSAVVALTMAWLGMLLGRRAARRRIEWHVRRGLCPACAYPVGDSDVCTECGKPVGEPEPVGDMSKIELEQGKPLTFSVEVEVTPDFELPALDGIEINKPMLEIGEDMVENELKRQQLMTGTANKVEGEAEPDDRLIGYATVTRNDEAEPFFRQDNVVIVHPGKADGGKGQALGLLIPDLHERLQGAKIGDTITIETTGPEGHEREDIRGAKINITFEVRDMQRITPADPAAVAARYGLPDEPMLREQIKLALEHRRDEEQASAMREQALEQLAEKVDFVVPEKLSAQQATRNLEAYRLEMLSQGKTPEEVEERLAEVRSESEEATRERLKRFFLLHRLGEHFKIEVSEQEVNGRIAAIAAQRGLRPEKLRTELAQSGRMSEVARMVRDQKACDRLVQQAKKTEVSADEWNKIFLEKQKREAQKHKSAKKA
jgi:trigger factor